MTEQYNQRNINSQGNYVTFANSAGTPNITLQPAEQLVMLDSTIAGGLIVTLPDAADAAANAVITLVSVTVAVGPITVVASAGDTIVASALPPLVAIGSSYTYRSDGISRWAAVAFVP